MNRRPRKTEIIPDANREHLSRGSILSFLPAHGGTRAGAVAQQLSRTLTEGLGFTVLLVDFRSGGFLEDARQNYDLICIDLTGVSHAQAEEWLHASESIFLMTGSDEAVAGELSRKAEWLRSLGIVDRCGMLVARDSSGASVEDLEHLTGLPMCSLIETRAQIDRFAKWIAANVAVPDMVPATAVA